MHNLLRTAATVLVVAAAAPAIAQDKCPTSGYLSKLKAKVEALGSVVRRARIDDGCHKVYITDKASGGEVEAYYNPATGELVQAKLGKRLK